MLLGMISSWSNFCIHYGLNLQEKPPLLAEKSWLQQLSRRGKFCMREWMRGMHPWNAWITTPNTWRLAGLQLADEH